MYLKKVEMNGFKSFADKTTLKILPGITSIVGPNGCGKTNIVDAISWVLGEQRVSLLRGHKMEDVIFNGAGGRPPVGMAEVTLTFDNTDGKLPIEFSEVGICRRVYRSGESEYLINKKPCRLRDINELILGTGLGHRSYSLVGQGRIDQILQARPEERRNLLEEAARISRYRQKKEEALRKLDLTETNMLRVNDIIKEVKRQLSLAERQARQAERYRQYRDQLRELETEEGLIQLGSLRRRARDLGKEKERWREKYRALEKEVEEVEKELDRLRALRGERREALSAARAELIGQQAEIDKHRHRIELNAERGGELKHERERLDEEIRSINDSLVSGKREVEELTGSRDELQESNQERAVILREKEKELRDLSRGRSEMEKDLSSRQSFMLESSRRSGHLRNEMMGLQAGGKELTLRTRKLAVELEDNAAEEEELRAEIEEEEPLGRQAEKSLAALRERLESEKEAAGKTEEEVRLRLRRKEEILIAVSERDSQKLMLENWNAEEPRTAADMLLAGMKAGEGSLAGVIGRLDDCIRFDPGYEKRVRAVLGELARAVVVRSVADALLAIEYLKNGKAGSVRLIVLDWLKAAAVFAGSSPGPADRNEPDLPGRVRFMDPLAGLERVLLGEPVPVSDLSRYGANAGSGSLKTVVTAGGAAASPPGIIFWAGEAEPDRARKLKEIEADLERLSGEKARLEEAENTGSALLKSCRGRVEEVVRKIHNQEMENALRLSEQERRRKNLQKLTLSREALKSEIVSLEEEERATTGRLKQLELELKECPSQDQIEEEVITALRERLTEGGLALRRLEADVTELKIALASSREREDGLSGRLKHLIAENQSREGLLEARRRRIKDDEGRERELRDETGRLRQEISELERRVEELRARVAAREEELRGLNRSCEEKEEIYRKVRPRFQEVQGQLGSQDVTLAELRMKEQAICQRAREKYRIELDELEVPTGEVDLDALTGEIDRIREKMGRMTNVNLAALEDKENYEARFTLLVEQKEDLEAAARDINQAIAKINVTAREKLQATYDIVRRNFQELFSRLFGGGQADLILDDDGDILEAGLDIIAQPPGKKLSHISLLSGGERALTTIALIFALFKVQPSPFYILDEIDAPLDEANIGRFVQLLKDLMTESQFIIITHNKQTISEADILYGITMEESGVSKVVSVRLASGEDQKEKQPVQTPPPASSPLQSTNLHEFH